MKKDLKVIFEKLAKQRVANLTASELGVYFYYRLSNLLLSKRVLVRDELEYLFTETGPGNLRFDPRHVQYLTQENLFVSPGFESIPEIQQIIAVKQKIESRVLTNRNSRETRNFLLSLLSEYLGSVHAESAHQIVVSGDFKKIPVRIFVKNGEWVLPSPDVFTFLRECQKQKRFPVIIARKISGILFPVFKNLSILGLNTYKTYLFGETKKLTELTAQDNLLLSKISYNNQFIYTHKNYIKNDRAHEQIDPIMNFFETTLANNVEVYYKKFLESKVEIADNFVDTVSQLRMNRATKLLLENYQTTQKVVRDLRK